MGEVWNGRLLEQLEKVMWLDLAEGGIRTYAVRIALRLPQPIRHTVPSGEIWSTVRDPDGNGLCFVGSA